jgi:hypothetical protein
MSPAPRRWCPPSCLDLLGACDPPMSLQMIFQVVEAEVADVTFFGNEAFMGRDAPMPAGVGARRRTAGVGDVAVLFGSSGEMLLLAGVCYLGSHRPQLPS